VEPSLGDPSITTTCLAPSSGLSSYQRPRPSASPGIKTRSGALPA
jgi:hypothetical protein